jgi:hypothetical protein
MSEYIEIYGTKVKLPERPKDEDAINFGKPRKEQKWERGELPDFFEDVSYSKDGKLVLTPQQDRYAEQELDRCRNGIHIWIGEKMRYITGRYYFYLKYYVLEDGNPPEFREADRLYFLFWQHWFHILWCLGIVRIKKRRQGASSQSCSNVLYEAIFFKNSNCGLLSKTRDDSKATFTEMITNAYQLLPCFFKQRLLGKEDTVTELVLMHDKGSYSKINYKAPVLNAYDRGRMSYVLLDEGGKYPQETPVSRLLAIISKTLTKGVKRVGWLDAPSTVNELTKGGGAEYKKVFEAANQFKRPITTNRLVRFFQPAYEAYEGFIDEFGDSVVDAPTEEQYEYLTSKWVQKDEDGNSISELSEDDIRLGAKVYVMHKRREGLSGTDLEEETRMNPCNEEEAFMFAGQGCEFNSTNINNQIKELEENPVYIRQCRLVLKKEKIPKIFPTDKDREREVVTFMDDAKGGWFLLEEPIKPNDYKLGNYLEPKLESPYIIGVDTTQQDRIAENGSDPAICVFKKSVIVDGEETGMYPVALWISPTRLDVHFDEEVRKACLWYSAKANYEIDRRTDYYRHFCKMNSQAFLQWTPKVLQNPLKRNFRLEYGSRSGDPFQLQQMLEISKMYIDGTDNEVYNGHVHRIKFIVILKQALAYDHSNRTPSDIFVALQMALVAVFGETQVTKTDFKKQQILPTFKINLAV